MSLQESLHFKKDFLSLEYFDAHSLPIFSCPVVSTDSNLRSLPRSPSASIFMESHHVSHKSQANTIHHISHQVAVLILHDPKLIFSGRNSCCTVDVFSIVPIQANHIWKIGREIKWILVHLKYISLKQLIQAFFNTARQTKTQDQNSSKKLK